MIGLILSGNDTLEVSVGDLLSIRWETHCRVEWDDAEEGETVVGNGGLEEGFMSSIVSPLKRSGESWS